MVVRRRRARTLARGFGVAAGFGWLTGSAKARTSAETSGGAASAGSSSAGAAAARLPRVSSLMAVLKRSVGRASLSSSCLRSHIGTR